MLYFPSPAKINRMLRIIRREENGYHYLQTVFQFTNLFDEIGFREDENDEITLLYENPNFSKEEDLIYRAAVALKNQSHCEKGVTIDLIKNLPMGAGIGGGSSNAATTLIVLNQLWDLHLTQAELMEIGTQLGADVPIFIYGHSAWAEGIGEQLSPIELPEESFLLINPGLHISTKVIFESPYLIRNSPLFEAQYFNQDRAINDCLPAIYHHYPEMKTVMELLTQAGFLPYITGTGSCLYIPTPTPDKYALLEKLAEENAWEITPFESRNRSLLFEASPFDLSFH